MRGVVCTLWMTLAVAVVPSVADEGAGTRGYSWARNPQGARAVALGGAYSAIVRGPMSSFWNPAGHAGSSKDAFALGYRQAFEGIHSGHMAASWAMNRASVGASLSYLSFGELEAVDSSGIPTGGRFTPSAMAMSVGTGWQLSDDGLNAGLEARLYHQSIDDLSSLALGVDLGMAWAGEGASAAFVVRNLGAELSAFRETKDPLPLAIAMGFAWHPVDRPLLMAIELEDPNDGSLIIHAGTEITVGTMAALRMGFDSRYRNQGSESELFDGLSSGFGLGLGAGTELSYAVTFQGELGTGHRVSVDRRFE